MRKYFLIVAVLFAFRGLAQDSSGTAEPRKCNLNHEIGLNATLLLKQVFNLSNNTFPTLPYNITYKLIWRDFAFRTGVGVSINNSEVKSTETNITTGSTVQPLTGPDQAVPTTNKSTNIFYRCGLEYRKAFDNRIVAYAGLDFIGSNGKSYSQSSSVFNNLPNSYNFTKTTDDATFQTYGGGPVVGIQFYMTKRLSIFTEMPVYFVMAKQTEVSESYTNNGQQQFGGSTIYTTTVNKQTLETSSTAVSIILPVTLYLAVKF